MDSLVRVPFDIANGQNLSAAVEVSGMEVEALEMPAAWTAAGLSFQVSGDSSPKASAVFHNLYSAAATSAEVVIASATADTVIGPLRTVIPACNFVKVRSGTASAPVAQGAARRGYLLCRRRA